MEKSTEKKVRLRKADKKTIAVIASLVVIILILAGVVLYMLFAPKDKSSKGDVRPILVTEDNAEDVVDELQDDSWDTRYNCRMSNSWTFENGQAESEDAYVANTDYNHYPVYFEVQLDESGEIVYKSPMIPVGSEIKGLTLDKSLAAGNYPATVIYHLMNENDEEVSSVGFTINIRVLH